MAELAKGYLVTSLETDKVLYRGNDPFKAIQYTFGSDSHVEFGSFIHQLLLSWHLSMQERLN